MVTTPLRHRMLQALTIRNCSDRTTRTALRFFYLHVMERPDLVVRIPYGRREKHFPIVLSVEEVLAVLAPLRSLRDRVVITVLYSAGLRLGAS